MKEVLIAVGLLALLGAASSPPTERRRDEPRLPPPPKKPAFPPELFEPIGGQARILEATRVVEKGGRSYTAKYYQPSFRPAPWTVRAWYDEGRGAHTIDIIPHPVLPEDDFTVEVRVGSKHEADRAEFRRYKSPLWPDDKYTNRVVHRVAAATPVCFLIDIRVGDYRLDFFHEPLVGQSELLIAEEKPSGADRFAQLGEIEEVETQYVAARAKLEQRADLSADVKRQLESHLLVMREEQLQKILRGE